VSCFSAREDTAEGVGGVHAEALDAHAVAHILSQREQLDDYITIR
jgi:hypothetical protein